MGTKTYKGRVTATTKMKEKNPAAVEGSSGQVVEQPPMKKSIQRRQIKSRFSRQRPVNNTSQHKKGRGRSQDSNSHKRMIAYSQEKRLKTYYSSLTGRQAKIPTESSVNCIPPKTANKEGQSNSPGIKVKDRNACSRVWRTENPQPPLTERSRVSSTRDNQRSKLTAVEKRRYQTVSEYQFIYPGKTVFYCTKESVKQQLRSIYRGPRGQKSLKPTHQSTQMPHYQWEKKETERMSKATCLFKMLSTSRRKGRKEEFLREFSACHWAASEKPENTKTDASCPMGSEFLKSKHPDTTPHGLASLMHKINMLVLDNEMETKSLCAPPGFPHSSQLQHQPPPSKSSPSAAALQKRGSSKDRKTSPEGGHLEQESSPDLSLQGASGNVPQVSPTSSTKPRPLSAKDCSGKVLSKKPGGEDNQNGDFSKKENAAESTPEVSMSSKGGVAHTQTTSTVPTFHQFSSKDNMNVEVHPSACSNTIQCLAEKRQQESFPVPFSQPSAREEKISNTLAHCSSGQKRQAYSFVTVGSK